VIRHPRCRDTSSSSTPCGGLLGPGDRVTLDREEARQRSWVCTVDPTHNPDGSSPRPSHEAGR